MLYLVWAKTDFTGTCCSKSRAIAWSGDSAGARPRNSTRSRTFSPARRSPPQCAAPHNVRPSRATVALEVLHRSSPPWQARRRVAASNALACRQLPHCRNRRNGSAQKSPVCWRVQQTSLLGNSCSFDCGRLPVRERVLFIGTQFSILYTFMYSPA